MGTVFNKNGGGGGYKYNYPVNITIDCNHNASSPQSNGAAAVIPLIGGLLKATKHIEASVDTNSIYTRRCNLIDAKGNTVVSLNQGTNDVSTLGADKWNRIVGLSVQGGHYTGRGGVERVATVTFKNN